MYYTLCSLASLHKTPSLFRTLTRVMPLPNSSPAVAACSSAMYPSSVTVANAKPRPRDSEKLPVVVNPMSDSSLGLTSPSYAPDQHRTLRRLYSDLQAVSHVELPE